MGKTSGRRFYWESFVAAQMGKRIISPMIYAFITKVLSIFCGKVLCVVEEEGLIMEEVAKRFDVGVASVMGWTKELVPKTTRFTPTKIDMNGSLGSGC